MTDSSASARLNSPILSNGARDGVSTTTAPASEPLSDTEARTGSWRQGWRWLEPFGLAVTAGWLALSPGLTQWISLSAQQINLVGMSLITLTAWGWWSRVRTDQRTARRGWHPNHTPYPTPTPIVTGLQTIGVHAVSHASTTATASTDDPVHLEGEMGRLRACFIASIKRAGLDYWDFDFATNRFIFSSTYKSLLGYENRELPDNANTWRERIHPNDRDLALNALEAAREGRDPILCFSHRLKTKDGGYRWVLAHGVVLRDEAGVPRHITGLILDLTSQRHNQVELRLMHAVVDHAADAVAITSSTHGRHRAIVYANPTFMDWLGMDASSYFELLGREIEEFFCLEDQPSSDASSATISISGRNLARETLLKRRDGSTLEVDLQVFTIPGEREADLRLVWVARDISVRKRFEAQLVEAKRIADQANEAKTRFLAGMSHEIRTPLNSVLGMTRLLMDTPLTAEQRDLAAAIQSSGESLLELVNGVLDLSKIESGRMELEHASMSPRGVVESVLDMIAATAERKGLEVAARVAEDVPERVRGDAAKLRQVLVNLASNAVKFTASGSVTIDVITLGKCPLRPGRDSVGGRPGLILSFTVRDTGVGIAPDKVSRLFDAYRQADASITRLYGGTGLGLAISKKLVELMGGEIEVESEPGRGSIFRFTIRVEPDSSHPVRSGLDNDRDQTQTHLPVSELMAHLERHSNTPTSPVPVNPAERASALAPPAPSSSPPPPSLDDSFLGLGSGDPSVSDVSLHQENWLTSSIWERDSESPTSTSSLLTLAIPPGRRLLIVGGHPLFQALLADQIRDWGVQVDRIDDQLESLQAARQSESRYDVVLLDASAHAALESLRSDPQAPPLIVAASRSQADNLHRSWSSPSAEVSTPPWVIVPKPVKPSKLARALASILADEGIDPPSKFGSAQSNSDSSSSTFVISLSDSSESEERPVGFDRDFARRHPLHILLADDVATNRKLMELTLARLGYTPDSVADGAQVLEALRQRDYDVILLDLEMPVLDGLATTQVIRREWPPESQPWLIALTARALASDRAECLAAGMEDYLAKPLRIDELTAALARAFRARGRFRPPSRQEEDNAPASTT